MRIGTGLRVCSIRKIAGGARLPKNLAEDAKEEIRVGGGEVETANEAANLFVGGGGAAAFPGAGRKLFEITAGEEGVEESCCDALEFGGGGSDAFRRWRLVVGIASEFVEAHGDGLAEVHGAMVFAGGDAQEPVAIAEIFVGEAAFFGAE